VFLDTPIFHFSEQNFAFSAYSKNPYITRFLQIDTKRDSKLAIA